MGLWIQRSGEPAAKVIEIGVAHLTAGLAYRAKANGDAVRVKRAFERSWSGLAGEPGAELDEALVALRAEWGEGGPVHLVIPGHLVLTKPLQVPATSRAQRDRIVAFEARQAIPFPLEEVVWDYAVIEEGAENHTVLLAAAKSDGVLGLVERVQSAGFEPVSLMPAGFALATAWQHHAPGPDAGLLLSLGARSTQVLLADPGRRRMRTLALGGNQVAKDMAENLQQSAIEAERLKDGVRRGEIALPADSPAGAAMREATARYCQRLFAEVGRFLLLERQSESGVVPAQVWLSGGAASMPGLRENAVERLGLPAAFWTIGGGEAGPDTLADRPEWWGGAHEALSGVPQINLLPRSLVEAGRARRVRPRWYAAAALLAVALALPGVHFQRLATARTAAAAALDRQAAPHRAFQAQVQEDLVAVERLEKQARQLDEVLAARGAWLRFLADLSARVAAVDDAWLERLQVLPGQDGETDGKLRISGRLLDREAPLRRVSPHSYEQATRLLQGLVESPFVLAIEGERFDANNPGILRFDFTLVLNPHAAL